MKIAILSRNRNCYSTRRLKEAALARGHQTKVLNTLLFGIYMEEESPELTFCGKPLSTYDCIIPRIGASITAYGTAVVRQFEQMGVYVLNPSHAINVSRDKLRAFQALSRHDIGLPTTAFVRRRKDVLPAIERVGGAPVIIKLLRGTQGLGVILAETRDAAAAIIETLNSAQQNVLIQKFVRESKGRDIRAFVVGDRVVAAIRREAQGQEFRSNVHRGGKATQVHLDEEYQRTAVQAARIMGLRVAGVDMLESTDGPQIMEVNSSPGLEGIEKATGMDIAAEIIQFIEEQVRFEDVDIRHRLSLAKGYTVAEFVVTPESDLANKKIADTHLRDQDVIVLSINRNGLVTPAPHGYIELMPGDVLLCYGKQITLRSFVPTVDDQRRQKQKRKRARGKSMRHAIVERGDVPSAVGQSNLVTPSELQEPTIITGETPVLSHESVEQEQDDEFVTRNDEEDT